MSRCRSWLPAAAPRTAYAMLLVRLPSNAASSSLGERLAVPRAAAQSVTARSAKMARHSVPAAPLPHMLPAFMRVGMTAVPVPAGAPALRFPVSTTMLSALWS